MKKLIPLVFISLALILLSTGFVKAACSALPPSRPDYFSYIQECDDKLSLKLDLDSRRIQELGVSLAFKDLPTVFDDRGVVSGCQVKEVGTRKSIISGREVSDLAAYCAGGELSVLADSYQSNANIAKELPKIAHSLRKFKQFLEEEYYSIGNLNIQNSIALNDEGKILSGKIDFPPNEDKHWIGGLVDDSYDAPEKLQVRGVSIIFQDTRTSKIVFNDPPTYFAKESPDGLEIYDVEIGTIAIYDNEKDTLAIIKGKFKRNGKEFKKIKIGFVGSETYFCSLDVEEPNPRDCVELRQTKDYYVSATNPLRGIFSIGSIVFAESKIKGNNVEYNYPKTLQEAKAAIKIPV